MTREVPVRVQHLGERRRAESRAQQEGEVALARTPPTHPRLFQGIRGRPAAVAFLGGRAAHPACFMDEGTEASGMRGPAQGRSWGGLTPAAPVLFL